jgi:tRNA isopentenyl-2-thiomethyl-A-37 hydroxylase MiaE
MTTNLDRINLLKAYIQEEPDNSFNYYALALEYKNIDSDLASFYFHKLLSEHKGYLPTYFHAANFFAEREEISLAKKTFEDGIQFASDLKDLHSLKELKNSYSNFLIENDIY